MVSSEPRNDLVWTILFILSQFDILYVIKKSSLHHRVEWKSKQIVGRWNVIVLLVYDYSIGATKIQSLLVRSHIYRPHALFPIGAPALAHPTHRNKPPFRFRYRFPIRFRGNSRWNRQFYRSRQPVVSRKKASLLNEKA
jgi:hypothetical protein